MYIGIGDGGNRESLREFVMRNARESKAMASWKKKGFEERLKAAVVLVETERMDKDEV